VVALLEVCDVHQNGVVVVGAAAAGQQEFGLDAVAHALVVAVHDLVVRG
jgi:hypothetical protein